MKLTREEFITAVTNNMNGDVSFLENMTDTFDGLDNSEKITALEAENRKLKDAYIARFGQPHNTPSEPQEDTPEETLTFDSLFKKGE